MAAFKRRRSKPLRFITAPPPVDHPSWLDLDRQLPPDHLARRIRFLVEQLDLDSLLETYSGVGGALIPRPAACFRPLRDPKGATVPCPVVYR